MKFIKISEISELFGTTKPEEIDTLLRVSIATDNSDKKQMDINLRQVVINENIRMNDAKIISMKITDRLNEQKIIDLQTKPAEVAKTEEVTEVK